MSMLIATPEQLSVLAASLQRQASQSVTTRVLVSMGTCGIAAGATPVLAALQQAVAARGLATVQVLGVGCVGLCHSEPTVEILDVAAGSGKIYGKVNAAHASGLLDGKGTLIRKSWYVPEDEKDPGTCMQARIVLRNCGRINPESLDDYIARDGYKALATVLTSMKPEDVVRIVTESGLRGRGGGGFPTGRKWSIAAAQNAGEKYIVCNADEGDPGAFMDRAVLEGDPHAVLEAMVIAGYAIGARQGIVYIRAEYPLAVKRLKTAIDRARERGFLGINIFGSGFDFDLQIKYGAGAFVCGEETALIRSIAGQRGMPTYKPPFPAIEGLWRKPTVVNNVETFANVPAIIRHGAAWFRKIGTPGSPGTKVFCITGKINKVGLIEVPMGTTLRDIIFGLGEGIQHKRRFKAVQTGGPSGGCITENNLDTPIDYDTLKALGSMMGSGGMIVMDEDDCMVDVAKFFIQFTMDESCGKCTPCRVGGRQMFGLLQKITRGAATLEDLDTIRDLAHTMKTASLCGLGMTSPNPVLATLEWFRDEYEAHIVQRRCPAGACKDLVGAPCQNSCPVDTEVWRYVAHIGRGEYFDAYRAIRSANPLPSICARVCHHPCERSCRAGGSGGEPIAIRTLKRFVVERMDPADAAPFVPVAPADAARIAVIGAGPAGLSAAHYLSLLGHLVTVFEREATAGGMLVGAIPAYRLTREVLEREIAAMLNVNIELKTGMELGRDITVDGLLAAGCKAVYLATGAHRSKKLDVTGGDIAGVIPGIRFLKAFNLHGETLARGRVGVVGGGNSAIDAARVARRQKGVRSVTVFYRRTRAEMPAYAEEIEAALAEGIEIEELVAPVEVLAKDGRLSAVRLTRNRLGDHDSSGRQKPVPVPGSEFDMKVDTLIVAISEEPEDAGLDGLGRTKWGTVAVDAETFATSRPGVFAGGDMVTGPGTVIDAIAAGKRAALVIDRYVRGKMLKVAPKVVLPHVYIEPLAQPDNDSTPAVRVQPDELPAAKRCRNFKEVELCIGEEDARAEARRCLRCDLEFTQHQRGI